MELSLFISSLMERGVVEITPELQPVSPEDIASALELLKTFHGQDSREMPGKAPAFDPRAAEWATIYFYQAVKLTVNREASEEKISEYLLPFPGVINPSSIYTADLILRHLGSLLSLAKGLAPADPLVNELKRTAANWPFSSAGMELDEVKNEDPVFSDASLRQEYIDRIILKKDKKRATKKIIQAYIHETTGEYTNDLWQEFKNLTSEP